MAHVGDRDAASEDACDGDVRGDQEGSRTPSLPFCRRELLAGAPGRANRVADARGSRDVSESDQRDSNPYLLGHNQPCRNRYTMATVRVEGFEPP